MAHGFSRTVSGLWFVCCGLLVGALPAPASPDNPPEDAPFFPTEDSEADQLEKIRRTWQIESIDFALGNGFFEVASHLCGQLLEKDLGQTEQQSVLGYQLQISLSMGNLREADRIRSQMLGLGMEPNPLMSAFLAYFKNDPDQAGRYLDGLEEASLSPENRAWRQLFEALLLSDRGETEAANAGFLLAERLAPTALLRDHFEIIRLRKELESGSFDEEVISALRESVRSMQGERGGFEAARLLAMTLNRGGFTTAAIDVLSSHLAMPGMTEYGLRPDFLLLLGMISGSDSLRGRLALRQLITEGEDREAQSLALALLAGSTASAEDRESFLTDLEGWLQRDPPHVLADRMLAYQAFLLQTDNRLSEAESSAKLLLERYPNSPFSATALGVLAFVSWNQVPPRYRTAADYLNRLRQFLGEAEDILQTGILIADCFFLNGDYNSASEGYGAVLRDASGERAQSVFFQQVLSEIKARKPEAAEILIDAGYRDPRIELASIWKAEWNLMDFFRSEGRVSDAFRRIGRVLEDFGPGNGVSPELNLRMRFISARLHLESGEPAEALAEAESLLAEIDGEWKTVLPEDLLRAVESHILLLMGESHYALNNVEQGNTVFERLRERYSQSGPAILSYLVESRSESAEDNLVSAQRSLIELVDRFPGSEYAPIALWEAALNAEQRGVNTSYQEAINILQRLVDEYPEHGLVYFARLKQGDLARRLNDFPTALLLYERLLSLYPGHPERYRAEISRADCLMALGSDDPSRFDVAAIIYERNCLLPSAPLSMRMEAGYKWANALLQQGDTLGCEEVFLHLYNRFILDPDMNQLILSEDAGRYWMARVLLQMGLQQSEKNENTAAITLYQTLISLDLPGSALAEARLNALR